MSTAVAVRRRQIRPVPLERQIAKRIDEPIAGYISREEAHAIAEATRTDRDRLLVRTLWHTGGRVSEVLQLRRCDYYQDYLLLTNLKQVEPSLKQVYIPVDFALDFLSYCERHGLTGTAYLFTNSAGLPLDRRRAWDIVKQASERAGVVRPGPSGDRPAWCHLFRHGHAVHLMREGVPGKIVQEQLGHASILTTQKYLRFTAADKREFIGRLEW